jgi:hypothetical protein
MKGENKPFHLGGQADGVSDDHQENGHGFKGINPDNAMGHDEFSRFTLFRATRPFCGIFSQKSVKYFWGHMKDAKNWTSDFLRDHQAWLMGIVSGSFGLA